MFTFPNTPLSLMKWMRKLSLSFRVVIWACRSLLRSISSESDSRTDWLICIAPCIRLFSSTSGGKVKVRGFYGKKCSMTGNLIFMGMLTEGIGPYMIACVMIDLIKSTFPVLPPSLECFNIHTHITHSGSKPRKFVMSICAFNIVDEVRTRSALSACIIPTPNVRSVEDFSSSRSLYSDSAQRQCERKRSRGFTYYTPPRQLHLRIAH